MPTAAKLVGGVVFALLAGLLANVYIPSLPDGTQTGWLVPSSAGIGLLCGWIIMGPLAGRGTSEALSSGIRVSITTVFWVLLVFAIYVMIQRSTKMLYDGPMEALLAVFDLILQFGQLMLTTEFIGTMLAGGAIAGLITEAAARRWS